MAIIPTDSEIKSVLRRDPLFVELSGFLGGCDLYKVYKRALRTEQEQTIPFLVDRGDRVRALASYSTRIALADIALQNEKLRPRLTHSTDAEPIMVHDENRGTFAVSDKGLDTRVLSLNGHYDGFVTQFQPSYD